MQEVQQINDWIKAGANIEKGLRLFLSLRGNTLLGRLVKLNPTTNQKAAIRELFKIAGKENAEIVVIKDATITPISVRALVPGLPKMREEWPFLSDTSCPPEFKILAADKLTAYHNYVAAHRKLSDCNSLEECYHTAKMIVDNYLENRQILEEFDYYKERKTILGIHPIFSEMNKLKELRQCSVVKLFEQKEKLLHNIWRIESEISKMDKPHLLSERERRLREKKHLLTEVERMLAEL